MKNFLFFVFSFFVFTVNANDSLLAPLVKDSLLLDIAPLSGGYVVVGERGHVLVGDDFNSLQQAIVPSRATLTSVAVSGDRIWAAGHDLTILHSADGGLSWQLQMQDFDADKPFLDIVFFDDEHGVAIGAYGAFYRTLDAGQTWQKELHASLLNPFDFEYLEEIRELDGEAFYNEELANILPHLNRIEVTGDRVTLVGETGLVAQSFDFGKTWQRLAIDYEGSLFSLANTDNGLLVSGLRGNTFLLSNEQWLTIDLCHSASVNTIIETDDAWVTVANNGYVSKLFIDQINSDTSCNDDAVNTFQTSEKVSVLSAIADAKTLLSVTASGLQSITIQ